MVTTYCHLCHRTISELRELSIVETNPIPKENINPNNGFTICNRCYNNNFSTEFTKFTIEVIRDKKLTELLKSRSSLLEPNKIIKTWKKIFK